MRAPVGANPKKSLSIVSTTTDESGDHLVASGNLLLDMEAEVGRSGELLGYRSLVSFSTGIGEGSDEHEEDSEESEDGHD